MVNNQDTPTVLAKCATCGGEFTCTEYKTGIAHNYVFREHKKKQDTSVSKCCGAKITLGNISDYTFCSKCGKSQDTSEREKDKLVKKIISYIRYSKDEAWLSGHIGEVVEYYRQWVVAHSQEQARKEIKDKLDITSSKDTSVEWESKLAQGLRNHIIDDVRFSGCFEYVKDFILTLLSQAEQRGKEMKKQKINEMLSLLSVAFNHESLHATHNKYCAACDMKKAIDEYLERKDKDEKHKA